MKVSRHQLVDCSVDSENMTHWEKCTWEETIRFICWRKCVRAHRLKTTIKVLRACGSFPVFPREMERNFLKIANNTFIMCLFDLFTCEYDKIREGEEKETLRCSVATDRTKHYERGWMFLIKRNNKTISQLNIYTYCTILSWIFLKKGVFTDFMCWTLCCLYCTVHIMRQ